MRSFFPYEEALSAYDIDYKRLYECGFRGIIYDIDNTLTGHGAPCEKRGEKLIKSLMNMGFSVCFLSNNQKERVESFNKKIGAFYVPNAKKPSAKGYIKAMELMGTDRDNTLMVGDQIFTDIYGANRAGIYSILCGRLYPKEEIQIHLKRILEIPVIALYRIIGK